MIAEIYRRYGPMLHRRCMKLVRDREAAGDLVQESFARYLAADRDWRAEAAPLTILYRIATNAAIDHLRRDRLAPLVGDEEGALAVPARPGAWRVESAIDLAILTKGLPTDAITVALLWHVDGCTQAEIADGLGLSRRTVGKALRRFEDYVRKRGARMGYLCEKDR